MFNARSLEMIIMKLLAILNIVFISLLFVTGCDNKRGPFEKAGEKVDQSVDDAKDTLDDVGDKMEDATDNQR